VVALVVFDPRFGAPVAGAGVVEGDGFDLAVSPDMGVGAGTPAAGMRLLSRGSIREGDLDAGVGAVTPSAVLDIDAVDVALDGREDADRLGAHRDFAARAVDVALRVFGIDPGLRLVAEEALELLKVVVEGGLFDAGIAAGMVWFGRLGRWGISAAPYGVTPYRGAPCVAAIGHHVILRAAT
jgi:hypothetical protein